MSDEEMISSSWKEKVYIETAEYIIRGYIYMPATGKRERMLSEALNSGRDFIAVKDCACMCRLPRRPPSPTHICTQRLQEGL